MRTLPIDVVLLCRIGDGHFGRRFGLCRCRRRDVQRPQRGRSASRTPVSPLGRPGRVLLEATPPVPEPHGHRARHLRVQPRAAREHISNRHRSGEYISCVYKLYLSMSLYLLNVRKTNRKRSVYNN